MDTNSTLAGTALAAAVAVDLSDIKFTDISVMKVEDVIWMAKAQIPFLLALIILCLFIKEDLREVKAEEEKEKPTKKAIPTTTTCKGHDDGGSFSALHLGRFLTFMFCRRRCQQSNNSQPQQKQKQQPIVTSSSQSSQPKSPKKGIIDSAMATVLVRSIQPNRLIGCSHKMEDFIFKETEKETQASVSLSEGEEKVSIDAHSDSHSARKTLQSVRDGFNRFAMKQYEIGCQQWNTMLQKEGGGDKDENYTRTLMMGTTYVPRRDNILHEWNIAATNDKFYPQDVDYTICDHGKDQPLEVQVLCPSSLLAAKHRNHNDTRTFHPCHFDELDLDLTSSSDNDHVPIVIYFHGGGYATGTPKDAFVTLLQSAIQFKSTTTSTSSSAPVLYLSVQYRLAPECPFPGAIIDSLSAVQYILDAFPHNPIHLAGTSAGGGIATVVGFECARMYPNRIESLALIQPMYNPRCDTESVAQDGPSSIICTELLQWFWSAYLQMKETTTSSSSSSSYMDALVQHPLFRLGRVGTINPLLRLVWPQVDIPSEEFMTRNKQQEQKPKIIISTATADPLSDEGLNLMEGLKDHGCGDIVESLVMKGDHGISILRDSRWRNEFVTRWSACLWPTTD